MVHFWWGMPSNHVCLHISFANSMWGASYFPSKDSWLETLENLCISILTTIIYEMGMCDWGNMLVLRFSGDFPGKSPEKTRASRDFLVIFQENRRKNPGILRFSGDFPGKSPEKSGHLEIFWWFSRKIAGKIRQSWDLLMTFLENVNKLTSNRSVTHGQYMDKLLSRIGEGSIVHVFSGEFPGEFPGNSPENLPQSLTGKSATKPRQKISHKTSPENLPQNLTRKSATKPCQKILTRKCVTKHISKSTSLQTTPKFSQNSFSLQSFPNCFPGLQFKFEIYFAPNRSQLPVWDLLHSQLFPNSNLRYFFFTPNHSQVVL